MAGIISVSFQCLSEEFSDNLNDLLRNIVQTSINQHKPLLMLWVLNYLMVFTATLCLLWTFKIPIKESRLWMCLMYKKCALAETLSGPL